MLQWTKLPAAKPASHVGRTDSCMLSSDLRTYTCVCTCIHSYKHTHTNKILKCDLFCIFKKSRLIVDENEE